MREPVRASHAQATTTLQGFRMAGADTWPKPSTSLPPRRDRIRRDPALFGVLIYGAYMSSPVALSAAHTSPPTTTVIIY